MQLTKRTQTSIISLPCRLTIQGGIVSPFVIGVMGKLNPSDGLDEQRVRELLDTFFTTLKPILPGTIGVADVVVLSGPSLDRVAQIAYETAARVQWRHEVQDNWNNPESIFHQRCNMLVRVGDQANPWFELQEEKYRARAGKDVSFWILN